MLQCYKKGCEFIAYKLTWEKGEEFKEKYSIKFTEKDTANEITLFENEEFGQVRIVMIDGDPWFVGKDLAVALGYSEPRSAVSKKVDQEDKGVAKMETPSGIQEMTIVNESGLYSLIFGSKLESAKRFKHWVTSEILPSIRKTGGYLLNGAQVSASQFNQLYDAVIVLAEEFQKLKGMVADKLDGDGMAQAEKKKHTCNPYSFDEMAVIEERKKELYRLTAKVAELCCMAHTSILHQMYRTLEERLKIVLDSYKSVYQDETGREHAGMVEVIAANDWLYEKAVDMNKFAIEKRQVYA